MITRAAEAIRGSSQAQPGRDVAFGCSGIKEQHHGKDNHFIACRRNDRIDGQSGCLGRAAAPAATAPAPVAPAPAVAQSNSSGTTYRSYSYDPAPVAAMPGRAPAYTFRTPTMERPAGPYMFRADRKMWGLAENPYNY
jgi:hypothetical protein